MTRWPDIGVHHGVSFDEYRAFTGAVNWHTLWRLLEESPAHAKYEMEHGTRETEALAFGSLTDFVLLEPGRFAAEAVIEPEIGEGLAPRRPTTRQITAKKPSPATVEAIRYWKEFDHKTAGKIVVPRANYDRVLQIERAVRSAQCKDYIVGGQAQVCLVWSDPVTGLLCKARLDYERYAGMDHYITDLKTARSAKDAPFQAAIFRYGYDGQMAWYHDGWLAVKGETSHCCWLAVEKEGLCVVKPWEAHEHWIAGGRLLYRAALTRWAECVKAGRWPDYGGPEILEMPGWAQERRGVGRDLIVPEPKYTGGGVPEGQEPSDFDTFIEGE